ncbi:hypothetical protein O6H91_17G041600 [Diphasiastrum complanatum]|uniref:Uncharacterized protein n=1 Tax=Diphasiastrum complanatum TaxID=34168 RepID=A0ACC2B731_DIPCM|nr:hypothetical protein O6H91_17G041600 [Diphasiastrum complanatum]
MAGSRPAASDTNDDIQRLRSLLLSSASTALDITALCPALEAEARHQPRAFFRLCFPLLLRRIFGYDDLHSPSAPATASQTQIGGGWLALVSQPGNEAAAQALVALLAPTGALFSSLVAADKENFVRYAFPSERLPDWVRRLLALPKGAAILGEVSVLFKNRLKELPSGGVQVELDVFQYYIFWFAYYAICKDAGSMHGAGRKPRSSSSSRSAQLRTQIEHWASSIPGLHHAAHHGFPAVHFHPYLHLLQLYLSHFVVDPLAKKGNSGSSFWHGGQSDALGTTHASILVNTLIDFWLVDDDPLPLPLSIRHSLHIQLQAGGLLSYIPPGIDLTDALKHLINYFNSVLRISTKDFYGMVSAEDIGMGYRRKGLLSSGMGPSLVVPMSSMLSSPIAPHLQYLQRPLYRFLLRAFRFWPVGSPVKNISHLVDIWLDFLEPWESAEALSAAQQLPKDSEHKLTSDHTWGASPICSALRASENTSQYAGQWQGYLLANYLFYTSLVGHFLEFTFKFVDIDAETIFQLIFKDWEEGILPNIEKAVADGSSTTKGYPSLQFFGSNEVGARHILQALILHAEAEAQVSRGKFPVSEQVLKGLKEVANAIFDLKMTNTFPSAATRPADLCTSLTDMRSHKALTEPLGLQRHSWAEVKYKGDWMRRPIENKEIAFLVRFLVKLSDSINRTLGLSLEDGRDIVQCQNSDLQASSSSVVAQSAEIPVQELELCLPELLKGVHRLLKHFCLVLQREMRRRGWRVNLRFMAEKQFLGLVFTVVLLTWMSMKITRFVLNFVSG